MARKVHGWFDMELDPKEGKDITMQATSITTDRGMERHELDELLTVDEVAALLKVSRSWVYEHTRKRGTPRSGRLAHVKVGKYVRFEPRAVREFVARLSTSA